MSQVLVWKSDADGKLFEDKGKYQKHLRKLANERRKQKQLAQQALEREAFLDRMGQVGSMEELNQFIKDNWEWFFVNGLRRNQWRRDRKAEKLHEYVDVRIHQTWWKDDIGNTHSCPRGGVENFNQRYNRQQGKNLPESYPGWRGRITIKVRPPMAKYRGKEYLKDGWGSDYFEGTIIHTGSGGGGGNKDNQYISYSYDVTLWADDFPVMKDRIEKQKIWQGIGGSKQLEFV